MHEGALLIARELLPNVRFQTIESPAEERLTKEDGVMGLGSIGPRFHAAIAQLRSAAPERIVTIGGTCGVEAAPIGYLNERYAGDLAVVWLDAHGDLNTPASSPSGHFHGMILRTLLGEGPDAYARELHRPLLPRQVFLAGTRDLDPPEQQFIDQTPISVTTPSDLAAHDRLAERVREAGFTRVYIHLDLDALNPADFPDTLMRTPGGPSLADIRTAISSLAARFDVAGFSIVEYVPGSAESLRVLGDLLTCAGVAGAARPIC